MKKVVLCLCLIFCATLCLLCSCAQTYDPGYPSAESYTFKHDEITRIVGRSQSQEPWNAHIIADENAEALINKIKALSFTAFPDGTIFAGGDWTHSFTIEYENGDTVNFTTSATQCRISDNGKNYFCDQLNYEDFTLFFD